ncbi:hypothetical protein HMPREF1531_00463 [Propionibacterium sp. oral taxon 192 str. F0372]|nr:hypothetical protein HMPREF1531_00463 [Propionibacterium sp. oral taxon 192 str. F0372]
MPTTSQDFPTSDSSQRLEAVQADLAERGVTGEVVVVSSTAMTWNDGSLGCPQPGQQYTQALVQGWQMIVTVGDQTYDYRFASAGAPLLCESPLPQVTDGSGVPASAR